MYHAVVKRLSLRNFDRINAKDYDAVLRYCAPDVHHRFAGDHALGGERHDREAFGRWLARIGRICPDLKIHVRHLWVKGLPHHTTVIARWVATQPLPDGSPYENHGVHIITFRWGKVVDIDVNEDTQLVAKTLTLLAHHGTEEAVAAQITS